MHCKFSLAMEMEHGLDYMCCWIEGRPSVQHITHHFHHTYYTIGHIPLRMKVNMHTLKQICWHNIKWLSDSIWITNTKCLVVAT